MQVLGTTLLDAPKHINIAPQTRVQKGRERKHNTQPFSTRAAAPREKTYNYVEKASDQSTANTQYPLRGRLICGFCFRSFDSFVFLVLPTPPSSLNRCCVCACVCLVGCLVSAIMRCRVCVAAYNVRVAVYVRYPSVCKREKSAFVWIHVYLVDDRLLLEWSFLLRVQLPVDDTQTLSAMRSNSIHTSTRLQASLRVLGTTLLDAPKHYYSSVSCHNVQIRKNLF